LALRIAALVGGLIVLAGFVLASGESETAGIVLIAVGLVVEAVVAIPRLLGEGSLLRDPAQIWRNRRLW
jgi:hypothetical protein